MKNIEFSRRNCLQLGALSLVSAGFAKAINQVNAQEKINKENFTPDEALQALMEGNERFINDKITNNNRSLTRIKEVSEGQNPYAILLSCADSRVPVELLFDQGFGDIFVVRNAGNIATPEDIGSIEFGSLVLGAKVIVVLGHGACGAVKAAVQGNPVPGKIQSILDAIKPAFDTLKLEEKQDLTTAIKANVKFQVQRLKQSPIIAQLMDDNKLKIVGGYYDLSTAKVNLLT